MKNFQTPFLVFHFCLSLAKSLFLQSSLKSVHGPLEAIVMISTASQGYQTPSLGLWLLLNILSVHSLVSIFRYLTAYNFWPIAFPLYETFINIMSSQKAFLSPLLQLLSSSLGILSIKVVSHKSFQANHY